MTDPMRHFIFLFLLFCFFSSHAQIGVNTVSPDTTSILDISSRQKGLLIPRMSSSERQAIQNKSNSLLVYDTDSAKYMFALNNLWYVLNPINAPAANSDSVMLRKKLSLGNPSNPVGNKLTVHGDETVKGTLYANQVNAGTAGISSSGPIRTTSDLQVGNNLTVAGNITSSDTISAASINVPGFGLVPKGIIVMWSGEPSAIPAGWALCDGTNGTPDLRGRFVVGYDNREAATPKDLVYPDNKNVKNYGAVGNTGGRNGVLLTAEESGLRQHNHSVYFNMDTGNDDNNHDNIFSFSGGDEVSETQPIEMIGRRDVNVIGTDNSVSSSAIETHENRPPYYVLAYIVKL